jgi:DNA polymerase
MSYDEFTAMYAKDVNNYIAVREDGSYHCKGGYVKELNDLDYDLPIVNEALKNYILLGTPVEETINACQDFRKFQKIVKLSNKYKWVEHERGYTPSYTKRGRLIEAWSTTTKHDNKAYRVFASTDLDDGRLLKCDGVRNPAKFGNTPDHCFVFNGDIKNVEIPSKLDRNYYVELAKGRLEDFGL